MVADLKSEPLQMEHALEVCRVLARGTADLRGLRALNGTDGFRGAKATIGRKCVGRLEVPDHGEIGVVKNGKCEGLSFGPDERFHRIPFAARASRNLGNEVISGMESIENLTPNALSRAK